MQVEAVIYVLLWIASRGDSQNIHAFTHNNSMNMLQEVEWEAQTVFDITFENSR